MAKKDSGLLGFFEDFNWRESYASLILGAIIVIILGLLVANFFSRDTQDIAMTGDSSSAIDTTDATVDQTYTVVAGDSLSKISEAHYGSQDFWPILASTNNISNPNLLFVDTQLVLPSISEAEEIRELATISSYEVQEGDTLFIIAEKVYGDGYMWPKLDAANNVGRLPNGNPLIYSGSTISIPR